jgi:hypothetical protein
MIKVECYIDDQLIFDADVRNAAGHSNLTDWTDDGIRSGVVREDSPTSYLLEQDGSNLVVLSSGLDASGDIDGDSRHYAWQQVEYLGSDNQHGALIESKRCHILYLFDDGQYYYHYLTLSGLGTITSLDSITQFLILLWAYDYNGGEEWMIVDNYLSGADQEDTVA